MQHFFYMGGFAAYVWSAYFITGLVLTLMLYFAVAETKVIKAKLRNRHES